MLPRFTRVVHGFYPTCISHFYSCLFSTLGRWLTCHPAHASPRLGYSASFRTAGCRRRLPVPVLPVSIAHFSGAFLRSALAPIFHSFSLCLPVHVFKHLYLTWQRLGHVSIRYPLALVTASASISPPGSRGSLSRLFSSPF